MNYFIYFITLLHVYKYVSCEIRSSGLLNKLIKVKPVGAPVAKSFIPLTEIPPPHIHHFASGRRHFEECDKKHEHKEVFGGPKVDIFGDYYDDRQAKTVATVIIPDHIDRKHFEVTTSVPYLTVGPIDAIGYHPSTIQSDHPSECEQIYQDHLDELYSDDTTDYSDESLEMARMPLFPETGLPSSVEERFDKMYSDLDT